MGFEVLCSGSWMTLVGVSSAFVSGCIGELCWIVVYFMLEPTTISEKGLKSWH